MEKGLAYSNKMWYAGHGYKDAQKSQGLWDYSLLTARKMSDNFNIQTSPTHDSINNMNI